VTVELVDTSVEWLVTLVWLGDHRPSRALTTLLGLVEVLLTAGDDDA
jgi:hypothetical protein